MSRPRFVAPIEVVKVGLYSLQVPSMGNGEGGSPPAFACGSVLTLAGSERNECLRLVPWEGA